MRVFVLDEIRETVFLDLTGREVTVRPERYRALETPTASLLT